MVANSASTLPRLRSVEAAKLLEHQMYFWGRDVLSSTGNLLAKLGCKRYKRDDAPHSVHCYEINTPYGLLVMHSTGIVLYDNGHNAGIAYLRATHKLYNVPPNEMPLPCGAAKAISSALTPVKATEFPFMLFQLLRLVRHYESWVAPKLPVGARLAAWREQKQRARHGVRWLRPAESQRWLEECLAHVSGLARS